MFKRVFLSLLFVALLVVALVAVLLNTGGQKPEFFEHSAELASQAKQALDKNPAERAKCRNYQKYRQPLFGDLHVHTAFSQDASTQGTRNTPFEAYRYAKGEKLGLQPYDENGKPMRWHQLKRPLDFAAVTDHAEQFGEVKTCSDPELPGFNSITCKVYRKWPRAAFFLMNTQANSGLFEGRFPFCGEGGEFCLEAAKTVWQEIQLAAQINQDYSEQCQFSTFIAYEWTGAFEVANLHRNVIFNGSGVPELPVSFYEAQTSEVLWDQLDESCGEQNDCEYIVIPHNSNLSDGYMFPLLEDKKWTKALAERHALKEPLMEIMQHKGSSECYFGAKNPLVQDEYCSFEQLPYSKFSGKYMPSLAEEVKPKAGFLREVLREGMRIENELGANPYKLGVIASSDTHLATPGYVDEKDFLGHGGAGVPASADQKPRLPDDVEFNPGGLAVVWAEENTRDSIFAALKRKETYGTSGPRMRLRSFVAESLPENLCQREDMLEYAYQNAKPMGSDFSIADSNASPMFLVSAQQDVDSNMPLQQIQMVKVWVDEQGISQEKVWTIAGSPTNNATVNTQTCEVQGNGFRDMCKVWKDPDFNSKMSAAYYVRVLENPSCRWHTQVCNSLSVDCSNIDALDESLQSCCSDQYPKTIQERAWSSPMWFQPTGSF